MTRPGFRVGPGALTPLVGARLSFAFVVLGPPCLAAYGSNPAGLRIVP